MAGKQIQFRADARHKVLAGAAALADEVRVTLGPKARCVLIETGDRVGDGTSTSTILAYEIFADGVRNVTAGAAAIDIRRGLQAAMVATWARAWRVSTGPDCALMASSAPARPAGQHHHRRRARRGRGRDRPLRAGAAILRRALEVPTRQIASNSKDAGVVVDRMRHLTGSVGFDAAKGTYVDLLEAGIVDATKVVRLALEHAVSVAGTLLLAEATITEKRVPSTRDKPQDEVA